MVLRVVEATLFDSPIPVLEMQGFYVGDANKNTFTIMSKPSVDRCSGSQDVGRDRIGMGRSRDQQERIRLLTMAEGYIALVYAYVCLFSTRE